MNACDNRWRNADCGRAPSRFGHAPIATAEAFVHRDRVLAKILPLQTDQLAHPQPSEDGDVHHRRVRLINQTDELRELFWGYVGFLFFLVDHL